MSLPPERISIKRRRQEEPVDTLVLERGSSKDHKRRLTDVYFQRLSDNASHPVSSIPPLPKSNTPTKQNNHQRAVSDQQGIPTVRATVPGDELKDFAKAIAAQRQRQDATQAPSPVEASQVPRNESPPTTITTAGSVASPRQIKPLQQARRFHLSRDLSQTSRPDSPSGIRKHRSGIRPPLATFIERNTPLPTEHDESIHKKPPSDKIVNLIQASITDNNSANGLPDSEIARIDAAPRTSTKTFIKPKAPATRRGQSIKDHPSTWDRESDQLADELAALAMELDPVPEPLNGSNKHNSVVQPQDTPEVTIRDPEDDDYIYETYIRVSHGDHGSLMDLDKTPLDAIGVLVIEEEDEELWQKYAEDEDESDWDEEDSNAEDNPANEYPEDEVSSDDEFDRNAYKYRNHASDEEEYDEIEDDDVDA